MATILLNDISGQCCLHGVKRNEADLMPNVNMQCSVGSDRGKVTTAATHQVSMNLNGVSANEGPAADLPADYIYIFRCSNSTGILYSDAIVLHKIKKTYERMSFMSGLNISK